MKAVACTPSDQLAPTKAASDVRRQLRADGMLVEPETKAPPRQLSRIEILEQRLRRLEQQIGIA
jgi:hypothetical protein